MFAITNKFIDQTYEYRETLWNDTIGWTNGKWQVDGRNVSFICDHVPMVGFTLKTKRDTTIHHFQLKLLLAEKETPVKIKSVDFYKNKIKLNNEDDLLCSVDGNIVKIYNKNYDSLIIKTFNYIPIKIKNTLKKILDTTSIFFLLKDHMI